MVKTYSLDSIFLSCIISRNVSFISYFTSELPTSMFDFLLRVKNIELDLDGCQLKKGQCFKFLCNSRKKLHIMNEIIPWLNERIHCIWATANIFWCCEVRYIARIIFIGGKKFIIDTMDMFIDAMTYFIAVNPWILLGKEFILDTQHYNIKNISAASHFW